MTDWYSDIEYAKVAQERDDYRERLRECQISRDATQQMRKQAERSLSLIREWAEGGWAENRIAPLQVPTGSIDDHLERGRWIGVGDAAREVLSLLSNPVSEEAE